MFSISDDEEFVVKLFLTCVFDDFQIFDCRNFSYIDLLFVLFECLISSGELLSCVKKIDGKDFFLDIKAATMALFK